LLLLETVSIRDGAAEHIEYHNRRLNKSRKELWAIGESIDLSSVLTDLPLHGHHRCRILYGEKGIESTEYFPYTSREIDSIALVESGIDYRYKYADRTGLDALRELAPGWDEVLIVRDGLVTDTTIANIAFREEGRWITPAVPLLEGTTRQRLIDNGFLGCREISYGEIGGFDGVALMNAMVGFRIITPQWSSIIEGRV